MQSSDERYLKSWPSADDTGFVGATCGDFHIPIAGRLDRLEYIAGLASSLAECADRVGSGTLAGLLILAHHEALKELARG